MAKKKSSKKIHESSIRLVREHARRVMKTLGKGQTERVYHRAMVTSLNKQNIAHRSEVLAPITYLGEVVGFGRCDLIIGNLVVELKANAQCPSCASPQLSKYMASMGATERKKFKGVVVNFNKRSGGVDVLSKLTKARKKRQARKT